ncbi:MAG: hypothetical protein U1D33_04075, partial [bacterium]|nr:hypothetical protein [bacterium]
MNTTVINIPGPLSLSVLTSADAFHAVLAANEIPILGADYAAAKRILPLLEKRLLLEGAGTKKLRRHVALLQRLALEDDRHLPLLWDIGYELKKYSADCHQRAANAVILAGAARFRDLPKIDKTTLSFLKEHRHPVFRTSDPETFLGKAVAETLEEIDASSIEFLREFRDSMAFFYPQHFGKEEAIDSNAPKVLMLRRAIVKEMRREIGDNLFRGGKPEDLSEKFLVKAASFPDVFMDAIRDFLPPYAQLVHVAFLSRHFLEQRHYGTAAYFCSSLKALMHGEISSQDRAMLEFWTTYAQAL